MYIYIVGINIIKRIVKYAPGCGGAISRPFFFSRVIRKHENGYEFQRDYTLENFPHAYANLIDFTGIRTIRVVLDEII